MKRVVLFLTIACAASCSSGNFIEKQAVRYVQSQYSDFDNLIMCKVDTVTIGDNLDYRIEQAEGNVKTYRMFLDLAESNLREMKKYGGGQDTSRVHNDRLKLEKEIARKEALDSLKAALQVDVLSKPTAYNCCVAYNHPSNLVWVQLDEFGRLLTISKDRTSEWLLNPGSDAPGYFEINDKYRGK